MRQIVRASLPLGVGVILDPFMGGGSTIAAAVSVGYESVGVEVDPAFFRVAQQAIPKLSRLPLNGKYNMATEEESPTLFQFRDAQFDPSGFHEPGRSRL